MKKRRKSTDDDRLSELAELEGLEEFDELDDCEELDELDGLTKHVKLNNGHAGNKKRNGHNGSKKHDGHSGNKKHDGYDNEYNGYDEYNDGEYDDEYNEYDDEYGEYDGEYDDSEYGNEYGDDEYDDDEYDDAYDDEIYDEVIVENKKRRKKRVPARVRRRMSLLVFVLIICAAIYFGGGFALNKAALNFRPIDFAKNVFYTIQGGGTGSARLTSSDKEDYFYYRGYIIRSKSNEVTFLSMNLKELSTQSIPAASPLVSINGNYMVIGDIGGLKFTLFNDKNQLLQTDMQKKIDNIDVSGNGYVTCVTDSDKGKNEVTVYDTGGRTVFFKVFENNYVIGAKYDPAIKEIVVNELDATGAISAALFELYNTDGNVTASYAFDGDIFPFWGITDKDYIYAYSDKNFVIFDSSGKEVWKSQPMDVLIGYTLAEGKYPVVADTETSSKSGKPVTAIRILNDNGSQRGYFECDDSVGGISAFDNLICAYAGNKVIFISDKGRLMGTATSDTNIFDVISVVNGDALLKINGGIMINRVNT